MGDERLENIDDLSQAELEKLEDDLAAEEDESGEPDDTNAAAAASEKQDTDKGGDQGGEPEPEKDGAPDKEKPAAGSEKTGTDDAAGEPGKEAAASAAEVEGLRKDVSPPSKWAAQRQAKRELKQQLEEAKAKAEKTDALETELAELKEKFTTLESALQEKGIKISPDNPLETFSEERIAYIRSEHGDELADMLQAASELLKSQVESKAGGAAPNKEQPAGNDGTDAGAEVTVDPEMAEALDDNDDLSYWRENSEPLWNMAVAKDDEFLKDPEYLKLSYEDRFKKVVEAVKTEVMQNSKSTPSDSADGKPPGSLSGTDGVAPTLQDSSAVEKILAIGDPVKQKEAYDNLSEAERDEVDKELGI